MLGEALCLLLVTLGAVAAQSAACRSAPTPAARIVCEQLHRWDSNARSASAKKKTVNLPPGAKGNFVPDLAPIATSLEACTDMACVCQFLAGVRAPTCSYNGKSVRKVVRKEYRLMTDSERQRYHGAINQLKQSGKYNQIASIHASMSNSGGAHSGPAFMGWHREFVKRFEFELRRMDPDLYVPYWDSALESRLPRPQDSSLFTPELMGNGIGSVTSGPFANWRTIENRILRRNAGGAGNPFTDADIGFVMNQNTIDQVLAYSAAQQGCPFRPDYNCLEYTHGNVHLWVGGDMYDQSTSANDPIFFLHHSFVDFIWEAWRTSRQSRAQRESDYPADNQLCASAQHFGASRMAPFNQYRNLDGLSNKYTDELYSYAPRPTCSTTNPSCGSRFLFCDLSHGVARCAAKVRVGGSCQGFVRGEDSCYNGVCQAGVCRPGARPTTTVAPVVTVRPPTTPASDCWNENQCCAAWASRGECTRNAGYMRDFCMASCGVCRPNPPIRDDCSNRHQSCAQWASAGECTKNPDWMIENCRRSCNRCSVTRAQVCAAGTTTVTQRPRPQCDNSPGCYNEYACCPLWANQGLCRSQPDFMICNCRVSCGMCFPSDYPYGACVDYHTSCRAWANAGECARNPWMEENCRTSCNTCLGQWELRSMCGSTASAGIIAQNRRRPTPQQTPRGGWGARKSATRNRPRALSASRRRRPVQVRRQPRRRIFKPSFRRSPGNENVPPALGAWDDFGWDSWGRVRRDINETTFPHM